MINLNHWKLTELDRLNHLLGTLPQTHTQANPFFSALVRSEALIHQGNSFTTISGIYRRELGQIVLYNSAFEEKLEFDRITLSCLDLTLYSLIGASVFGQEALRDHFAAIHYPEFDQGPSSSLDICIFDRELIRKELHISPHQLAVVPGVVSLDWSFALFYACYVLLPNLLGSSRPQTYQYFKEVVFDGREYQDNTAVSAKKQSKIIC